MSQTPKNSRRDKVESAKVDLALRWEQMRGNVQKAFKSRAPSLARCVIAIAITLFAQNGDPIGIAKLLQESPVFAGVHVLLVAASFNGVMLLAFYQAASLLKGLFRAAGRK